MHLVLLGPPGGGKGTQADFLHRRLGLVHLASGDLFRDHMNRATELGVRARGHISRGELVPDDVTIGMVWERLGEPDASGGTVLDGFPRTVAQAEALDRMLPKLGCELERCVALTVDEDELVKRLLRRAALEGRSDDNEASIRTRMREYREKTEPLIAYYRKRGALREVNGIGEIEEVARRIAQALDGAETR